MNRELLNQKLSPLSVLTIYADKHQQQYYIEQREVKQENGQTTLMAPQPMPEEILKNVAKAFVQKTTTRMNNGAWMPEHILHAFNGIGNTIVMWYRPAMVRTLNFESRMKVKGGRPYKVPATLYCIHNRSLYVFALESDERPTPKTKIYNAPFFNIYEDGNVCMGSAYTGKVKGKTFEDEANRFERAFYMAEQNGGDRMNTCKSSLTKVWTALAGGKKAFPKAELIQHKYKTIEEFISKKVKRNSKYEDED